MVDEAERVIERMNRVYEESGVYIRFFLEKALRSRYMYNLGHTTVARKAASTADIAIGRGITCPNAGWMRSGIRQFHRG